MRKILLASLLFSLAMFFLTSARKKESGTERLRIGALKGPTALGMLEMMDAGDYDFTVSASSDEITTGFLQDRLDIIAVPVNLGAVLDARTNGNIQMLAINTLGVLCIVSKNAGQIRNLSDLKGKTIYATGKGTIPEAVLGRLFKEYGIDMDSDVNMQWKSEPSEIVALLAREESGIAMLPNPFASIAQQKANGVAIALDLNEEWKKCENGKSMITGAAFVKKDFAAAHPDKIKRFIADYSHSCKAVTDQLAMSAKRADKYNIVKEDVALTALPLCNIVCITGDEMKESAAAYLQIIFDSNAKFLGGKMPEDAFYYRAK